MNREQVMQLITFDSDVLDIHTLEGSNIDKLVDKLANYNDFDAPTFAPEAERWSIDRRAKELLKTIEAMEKLQRLTPEQRYFKYFKEHFKGITMARALSYVPHPTKYSDAASKEFYFNDLVSRMKMIANILDGGLNGFGREIPHAEREGLKAEAHAELTKRGYDSAAAVLQRAKKPFWALWGRRF